MTSSLSWLDFSEQEQRQVLSVVELFRERGTVDELGVGVVRDAIAELLFPGTSTLHARGRYLLFIPWIYEGIESRPSRWKDPWAAARWAEIRLINALVRSDEPDGTIGRYAGAQLKVFPSTVYWVALLKWGIRRLPFSQDQYHRWLRAGGPSAGEEAALDEGGDADRTRSAWHSGLPPIPEGFPEVASFRFGRDESAYAAERIAMSVPGTLLARLVEERVGLKDIAQPWDLPAFMKVAGNLVEQLEHASRFSLAINGAPLLYNLMLAEKSTRSDRDKLLERFRERLSTWVAEMEERDLELSRWDRRGTFWETVHDGGGGTPALTRRFIEKWLDLAIEGDPAQITENAAARKLISERERQVKGPRARLHNAQALANWGGDSGTARLDFRWTYARQVVSDIADGWSEHRA